MENTAQAHIVPSEKGIRKERKMLYYSFHVNAKPSCVFRIVVHTVVADVHISTVDPHEYAKCGTETITHNHKQSEEIVETETSRFILHVKNEMDTFIERLPS